MTHATAKAGGDRPRRQVLAINYDDRLPVEHWAKAALKREIFTTHREAEVPSITGDGTTMLSDHIPRSSAVRGSGRDLAAGLGSALRSAQASPDSGRVLT